MHSMGRLLFVGAVVSIAAPALAQDVTVVRTEAVQDRPSVSVLDLPARLVVEDARLATALERLRESSGVVVAFSPSLLPLDGRKVTCMCQTNTVREALDRLLAGTPSITYTEVHGNIVVHREPSTIPIRPALAAARYARIAMPLEAGGVRSSEGWPAIRRPPPSQGSIVGRVTDASSGAGIPGVNVTLQDTRIGTTTNAEGRYRLIDVPIGDYTLIVERLGFEAATAQVAVTAGETATANFAITPAAVELEGIVAVGYGTQQSRDLTGAVGSVSAQDLENVQVPSIAQVLQGRVAGVNVTQASSAPGGGVSIRIRGSGSLDSSNEPLYVIDGIPISGGDNNDPGRTIGRTVTTNPLAFLSPEDIESVEVLKDASSTAIYGARGTNGVVLITTNRGTSGSQIVFESSISTQRVAKRLPMLNGREYAEAANEWARLKNRDGVPFPNLDEVGAGLDYMELILRDGAPMMEHNVSVLGGTDATRFSVSANYMDQQGLVKTSEFQRYSLRANVQHELRDWLTLGTNLNASRLNSSLGFTHSGQSRQQASAIGAAQSFVPLMPMYNENGDYTWLDRDFLPQMQAFGVNGTNIDNPLAMINEQHDAAEYDRLMGNLFAEASLFEGATLRLNVAATLVNNQRNEYFGSRSRRGDAAGNGLAQMGVIDQSHYLGEALLNFRRSFGAGHDLDVLAGTTIETEESLNRSISNRNFPNDLTEFYNIGAGTPEGGPGVSSGHSDWTLLSYLGRINYSLLDRYLFTLTGRADGSSKFGEQNKWGLFPSAAFAWRVSEESFLRGADWLTDLKLRLSYGQTGNQEIGTYGSLARIETYNYNLGQGTLVSGHRPVSIGNPELRWEKSEQFDAGLDAAFLNNRVSLTVDVYRKITDDLLLSVPLPYETGFTSALQNLGSVKNEGIEVSLGFDVLDGSGSGLGALGWRTSLNLSRNRNEVLEIGDREEIFGRSVAGGQALPGSLVREGEPMGVFYVYKVDGVFRDQAEADAYVGPDGTPILPGAAAGQRKIVDVNGDGTITADDRVIAGNPEPDFSIGWSNDITLGAFSLYTFFQGTYGNEIFNANLSDIAGSCLCRNLYRPRWEGRWTPENPDAEWPVLALPDGVGYSHGSKGTTYSWSIQDGSYLRLRHLTLSYDLPAQLASRLAGMQTARIFLQAENLFTWTSYVGVNPDVNSQGQHNINRGIDFNSYPFAKVYRVGVRLGL